MKAEASATSLITIKVLDARSRGATTEAYGATRRKPFDKLKVEREERSKVTPLELAKSRLGGEIMP